MENRGGPQKISEDVGGMVLQTDAALTERRQDDSREPAVMNAGRIEQVGTGDEIYSRPGTAFAASFVGESNVFRGRVAEVTGNGAVPLDALADLCRDHEPGPRGDNRGSR